MSKQPLSTSPWTIRRITGLTIWIVVLATLPIVAQRSADQPAILLALAAIYVVIAFGLRSRLIICTLAGLVFGVMLIDGSSRNRSEEYRVWQPVMSIGVGTLIGVIIGFLWDHAAMLPENTTARARKKR